MLTLVAIGFLAGLVTALSPCVLPVLPGILAGSSLAAGPGPAAGSGSGLLTTAASAPARVTRRRPYLIVAGLLTSFTLLTLLGATVISAMGAPAGMVRSAALVTLAVVGLGLLIPVLGHQMERMFYRVPILAPRSGGSGFVFGLTLGVVFVPCAGPVLTAITVLAATQGLSAGLVVLTLAFAAGLAIPLLLVAGLGAGLGRRLSDRMPTVRRVAGGVFLATGLAMALGLADSLQRAVPGYAAAVQQTLEDNDTARRALDSLRGGTRPPVTANAPAGQLSFDECAENSAVLADCGRAPELTGIVDWLNTSGDSLSLAGLQAEGRVVLVDFWTYSCINCQRTLAYTTAWDAAYRDQGLTVIGVHSPEFAFEREVANVAERAADFGVAYPIAIDNDFATWQAYDQRYWPAHYLIDRSGTVRQVHYGEGAYAQTEALIRQLLAEGGATAIESARTPTTPEANLAQTPEIYLGASRAGRGYTHRTVRGEPAEYTSDPLFGRAGQDRVTLKGTWTVRDERIDAGPRAGLILDFSAARVFLVIGGEGTVTVREGDDTRTVQVSGAPTLYEVRSGAPGRSRIGVYLDEGMSAYAFTFG